jgi:hypothetical protein
VEDVRGRLAREGAQVGAVTASLAWNHASDLDLHAEIQLASGTTAHISYRNKNDAATGGHLDVDMHYRDTEIVSEPVENIYWESPPQGIYFVSVNLYKRRGDIGNGIPFKAVLAFAGQEPITVTSAVSAGKSSVQCFKFEVSSDGTRTVLTQLEDAQEICASSSTKVTSKAKAKAKAKAKVKAKAKAKATTKAKATVKAKTCPAQKITTTKKKHIKKAAAKCKSKVAVVAARKKTKVAGPALKKKSSKFDVFHGKKETTRRGLKKSDFVLSKHKKIVTRKKSEAGRKSGVFALATARAYAKLGITGFTPVRKGTPLHKAALEELALMSSAGA